MYVDEVNARCHQNDDGQNQTESPEPRFVPRLGRRRSLS
jgi:hypothetical protein